jgi:hypothetical protein
MIDCFYPVLSTPPRPHLSCADASGSQTGLYVGVTGTLRPSAVNWWRDGVTIEGYRRVSMSKEVGEVGWLGLSSTPTSYLNYPIVDA